MIRIARGPEPTELLLERRRRLSNAILARAHGQDPEFAGYEVAKAALTAALNHKCVFCEFDLRAEGSPVEHFRPKAYVHNESEVRDATRYWWLAWTWANLLYACDRCNTGYKRNQFPLAAGSALLPERSEELGVENPLLIDPSRMDPTLHISFQLDPTVGRWVAVPISGSVIGGKTISVLGLDEDDRLNVHVDERVRPAVAALMKVIDGGGNEALVQGIWETTCLSLFAPHQPFHALTHDALMQLVPQAIRVQFALQLPVLGKCETPAECVVFDDPIEFALLDDETLKLRLRALGEQAEWNDISVVLQELIGLANWSADELARLLNRAEATVGQYRKRLGV